MIFVTVGTHEQQFNRLVKKVDELKGEGLIKEDVLIQTGYSTYKPRYCEWKSFLSFHDMEEAFKVADIIITHGGPASFMKALQYKKMPIVVPRKKEFGEHINHHQVVFSNYIYKSKHSIIVVEEIDELANIILEYESKCKKSYMNSNNKEFNDNLQGLLREIIES